MAGKKIKKPILNNNAHMINLIGDDVREWVNESSSENTKIHLYNKSEIKKGRKTPSLCIFFLRTRKACSTLLSLTETSI